MKRITDKSDLSLVEEQARDLKMIQRVLNAGFRDIFKMKVVDGKEVIVGLKETAKIGDIDKLLRLKYFLAGEPDSRSETRIKGEVNQVVSAVIAIITRHVKDQRVRNSIADELLGLVDFKGDSRGTSESRLPH